MLCSRMLRCSCQERLMRRLGTVSRRRESFGKVRTMFNDFGKRADNGIQEHSGLGTSRNTTLTDTTRRTPKVPQRRSTRVLNSTYMNSDFLYVFSDLPERVGFPQSQNTPTPCEARRHFPFPAGSRSAKTSASANLQCFRTPCDWTYAVRLRQTENPR